jgi:transcriptional regulator with XRE-family HTH domain
MAKLKGASKVGEKVGSTVGARVGTLGDYIKEQRLHAQFSLRQLADAAGVSNPYLSQIERGLKKPSAEILQQIAKALRLSAESLYVRAGILEERAGEEVAVPAAIYTDPVLTERQKRALIDIYTSFRAESLAAAEASQPAPERAATTAARTGATAKKAGAPSARKAKATKATKATKARSTKTTSTKSATSTSARGSRRAGTTSTTTQESTS